VTAGAWAKLGIVAGAGEMPRLIMRACEKAGRPYFVAAVDEFAEPFDKDVPHERNRISKIGATFAALKRNGCSEVVFAGKLQRPDGGRVKLRPDWGGLVFLARLFGTLERSDDRLHRTIAAMLAERGMIVVSPLSAAPDLAARAGCLTKTAPTDAMRTSFKAALRLAKDHGATKQGQAIVVDGTEVLAREGRAGTDAMIESLGGAAPKSALLVKAMAPTQLMTMDPPAIGESTVVNVAKAGLGGILIEAGRSVIVDEARVAARADALGVFVYAANLDAA
jgi:UDP-2,3-diacylglucosamine hydrolase